MEQRQSVDFWLLISTLILAGIGLVMVYSSSMVVTMDSQGDGMYFFKKQAVRMLLGLVIMMLLTKVNYRGYAKLANGLLVFGFILLTMLLFQGRGGRGVDRWLRIFGFSFQPSELMKVIMVVFLSAAIARMGEKIRDFKKGFLPLLGAIGAAFALIVIEPDLGTAGLVLAIGFIILFVGRAKFTHLLLVTMPSLAVVSLIAWKVPYMQRRIDLFLNPEAGYQVQQSIIGIGSGGVFGVGLGNSVQKFYFLPERHTDFVFSIFAEEAGLAGTTLLLCVMFLYLYRGLKVAEHAPDVFGFLMATGLTMMTGMQIFINIGVATRLLPTTGMTLPFISYGGSSLILSFIATGILLNISKQANVEKRMSREFGSRLHKRSVWQ